MASFLASSVISSVEVAAAAVVADRLIRCGLDDGPPFFPPFALKTVEGWKEKKKKKGPPSSLCRLILLAGNREHSFFSFEPLGFHPPP